MTRGWLQIAAAAATVTVFSACSSHADKASSPSATTTLETGCHQSNLAARFAGGGMGTGNDFGSIVIWNTGSLPCRVAGAVTFTAFFSGGHPDPNAQPNRRMPPVDVVLAPNMAAFHDGEDPAGYLTADLMGAERDDPSQPDALCRQQDKLAPAILVLRLGRVTFRVSNSDPRSLQVKQVYGCHGRVLLEGVERPT